MLNTHQRREDLSIALYSPRIEGPDAELRAPSPSHWSSAPLTVEFA